MAKASQVVKAILGKIIVGDAEAAINPIESQDTIFAMNNFMTALDADGISVGYTIVSSLDDDITVPPGAILGIICNVAITIAQDYGASVSASTIAAAKLGLSAMRKLARDIQPLVLPSTMPIGSGNEQFIDSDQHFFPGNPNVILTETGNNILLEDDTDGS